jgi:hypothetical protein
MAPPIHQEAVRILTSAAVCPQTLHTAGIQQLGWCTISCPFTPEEGVGDAPDSYAYDGKRLRKWSVKSHPYGQAWAPGTPGRGVA